MVGKLNILLCERISNTNPYIKELTNAYQKKGHNVILDVQNLLFSEFLPDILHIQWPEAIYRWRFHLPKSNDSIILLKQRLIRLSKARIPIVYTIHNILPHENVTEFDRVFFKTILSFANIVIHHGRTSIPIIKKTFPESKNAEHIVCPHGPYKYIAEDSKSARKFYGLPKSKYVFLNFGRQRCDKGVYFIEQIFRNFSSNKVCLFTIGPKQFNQKKDSFLSLCSKYNNKILFPYVMRAASFLSNNKKTILRFVENAEIPQIVAATDIFFLGHKQGLNSGLLALAATYGKPVVFPKIGNFEEQLIGWPWKESYEAESVKSAIFASNKILERVEKYPPGSVKFDNSNWLKLNSWEKHVGIITDAVDNYKNRLY